MADENEQSRGRQANLTREQRNLAQLNKDLERRLATQNKINTAGEKSLAHAKDALGAFRQAGSAAAEAYDSSAQFLHQAGPSALRSELEAVQQRFGGMTGPGGMFDASNKQAKAFVQLNQEVYKGLLATAGPFAEAFGEMPLRTLGNLNEVMGDFNQLITGDQGMLNSLKIAEVATGDFVLEQQALAKALDFSTQEQQQFMSRQISLTGEASNDMLREAAVYSKKLASLTGDSMKMISKNIAGIIDDTEHFGNVTVAEAARISVTLRQLGLGYKELGGMTDKFMNFEGAAESVSNLTAVFGVQMDAMEMMQLANTDQEQFLRRMRENFLATGKSVDDMTLAEKRLIKEQLGLSDVQAVERFLDPGAEISSYEELTQATADSAEGTSEVMKMLAGDIVDLRKVTDFETENIQNNINERLREPLAKTALQLEETTARHAAAFEKFIPEAATAGLADFGKGITALTGLDPAKIDATGTAVKGLADAMATKGAAAGGSKLASDVQGLGQKVAPKLTDTLVDGFKSAFDVIIKDFKAAIDGLVDIIKKSPLYGTSPSLMGEAIASGLIDPMKGVSAELKKTFDEGGIDVLEMMKLAKGATDDYEKGSAESLKNIRKGFLDAGHSVDDMTLAEQRLVQTQAGLKDIGSLETLLDPNAVIDDLTKLTELGESQGEFLRQNAIETEKLAKTSKDMLADLDIDKMVASLDKQFDSLSDASKKVLEESGLDWTTMIEKGFDPEKIMKGLEEQVKGGDVKAGDLLDLDVLGGATVRPDAPPVSGMYDDPGKEAMKLLKEQEAEFKKKDAEAAKAGKAGGGGGGATPAWAAKVLAQLAAIQTAIDNKEFNNKVEIDGGAIVDYVTSNPTGPTSGQRIALKPQ